ncbi:hypothetical protein ACQ7B2_19340, partial [Escherichia coli]
LVAWSLGVEAIFYVLVPIGAFIVWRLSRGQRVPLDRLVAYVLGVWAVAVAISFAIAVAYPHDVERQLPGGM